MTIEVAHGDGEMQSTRSVTGTARFHAPSHELAHPAHQIGDALVQQFHALVELLTRICETLGEFPA